jgi:DNA-binding XRE family transcriptional regulator
VIEARIRAGLTQAELAERIGTRLRIVLEPVTR